jgi:HSP20 family protein
VHTVRSHRRGKAIDDHRVVGCCFHAGGFPYGHVALGTISAIPLANISESENEYLIKIELPDVKKEDVKIAVADGIITISGERKLEREDKAENAIRVESMYGAFTRSSVLPDCVEANGIRAEAKDGVLHIHVPKAKTKKSDPLAIEVH